MTTCVTEYIGPENYPDLPCLTALRMSSNIPLVFDRFKYMDNYYIDGGVADNFAIQKGEEIGNHIFGLYLKIDENSLQDDPEDGILSYFIRLLQIPVLQSTKTKVSMITGKTTVIGIDGGKFKNMLEFDIKMKARFEMFSRGYSDVKEYFKDKTSTI
jgi:predicted patatin/cPLA2 family phospholipase